MAQHHRPPAAHFDIEIAVARQLFSPHVDFIDQAILPALTLGFLPTAFLARVTRASMLEVLRQDYIRTARAKGLDELIILYRHILRNALIPVVTVIGPIAAALATGSFIVEQMFSVPGIGRLFVQSIEGRDYGMIMGQPFSTRSSSPLPTLLSICRTRSWIPASDIVRQFRSRSE